MVRGKWWWQSDTYHGKGGDEPDGDEEKKVVT